MPRRGRIQIQLLLALALLMFSYRSRLPDPQRSFDQAWRSLQRGDLIPAEEQATRGYDDFHSLSQSWACRFAILKARVLYQRGAYEEALRLLASQAAGCPAGDLAVKKLWVEGLIHTSLHRFPEAETSLKHAEELCASAQYPTCGDVTDARGELEMERGNYAQAQVFFDRVLARARAGQEQFWEAATLLNLSHAAEEQTHFDEAIGYAKQAQDLSTAHSFAGLAEKALGNMAWAYYKLGDSQRALAMFADAGRLAGKVGNQVDQLKWILDTGYIYFDTRDFEPANRLYRQSLDLAEKLKSKEDIINALQALAFLSEETNQLEDARRYAEEALAKAQEDNNGRDRVYPRLVQGRIAARLHDSAAARIAFREVAQSPDTPEFLKWEAERSLARLDEDERKFDSARQQYRAALTTFESARAALRNEDTRLPFLGNAARIYDDYIHFLIAQGNQDEALQVAAFSRGRTLDEGLGKLKIEAAFKPDPLDAPEVARRASGTILFYWLGERQSYLWAITPLKSDLFILPAGAEIEGAAQRYRRTVTEADPLASADSDGQYLYRTLVLPARELLRKSAKVVIVPDGSLNNLNFDTLLVPEAKVPGSNSAKENLHYWIEDATIVEASSLRIDPEPSQKRGRSLLLVGNSVSPSKEYPELPQAAAQMESVARHFPAEQETVITRAAATPAAYFASHPERYSYIHFVAHGQASRLSPLDSAIMLSKSPGEDDSFKLYARDVVGYAKQHRLKAELVTVSACYSAGERGYSGEGLVGLSWAFLRSGAHNVIAALWDASDAPTQKLMDKFYDGLNAGKPPEAALRDAKLSLLRGDLRNPVYWAPFQLYSRLN